MTNVSNGSPAASAGRIGSSPLQGVGWIVLDNPTKHNAISLPMWRTLIEVLGAFEHDPSVRCVVIRGEGERAFCAGADIAEKQGVEGAQALADLEIGLTGLQALKAFSKPLIAMVSGYCIGAGMGIALSCDMRIAGGNASFGIPAARLGIGYPYTEMKRLAALVGPSIAMQIVCTADRIGAERALAVGLANEVVPLGELLSFTTSLAGRIAANAPLSIAVAKQAIALTASDPPGRDVAVCEAQARACLLSADYAEGRLAFKEKRLPVFTGQ